jgi:hypothetical protein
MGLRLVTESTLDALTEPDITGALVHRPPWHWTAIRHVRGQWWLLDSMESAPRVLTRAQVAAYVAEQPGVYPVRSLGRAAANTGDRPGSGSLG